MERAEAAKVLELTPPPAIGQVVAPAVEAEKAKAPKENAAADALSRDINMARKTSKYSQCCEKHDNLLLLASEDVESKQVASQQKGASQQVRIAMMGKKDGKMEAKAKASAAFR